MISYVCKTCRTRLYTRIRQRHNYHRRQWLSQSEVLLQNGARETLQNNLDYQQARGSSGDSRPAYRGNGDSQSTPPMGRYSSRALRPQELLDQLGNAPQPDSYSTHQKAINELFNGRQTVSAQKTSSNERRNDRQLSSVRTGSSHARVVLAPPVQELRKTILRAARSNDLSDSDHADIWPTFLTAVPQLRDQGAIEALANDHAFSLRFRRVSGRLGDEWLTKCASTLLAQEQDGKVSPQPSLLTLEQIILLRAILDDQSERDAWIAIWGVARELSEFYGADPGRVESMSQYGKDCIHQLMSLWNLCMGRNFWRRGADGASLQQTWLDQISSPSLSLKQWSFLPELDEEAVDSLNDVLSLVTGNALRTRSDQSAGRDDAVSAALLTLDLLQMCEKQPWGRQFVSQYQPWMNLIDGVLKRAARRRVPQTLRSRLEWHGLDPAIQNHYHSLIDRFRLDETGQTRVTPVRNTHATNTPYEPAEDTSSPSDAFTAEQDLMSSPSAAGPSNEVALVDRMTYLSIKRLGRSVDHEDFTAAERVRQNVLRFNSEHPTLQLPLQLYEHLLLAFLSLKRLDPALECWKNMVKAGHRPTVKTYTVAIRHSQHLKSIAAVEHFWGQMRQNGLQPDQHAWTARILSVFRRGEVEYGMRALNEMGREWVMAARRVQGKRSFVSKKTKKGSSSTQDIHPSHLGNGDIDGVPKPNVYVLNAAIGALSTKGREDMIPQVLSWSRQFNIELDVYSYNTLINVSMRNGTSGEAMKLLRRMKENNINANDDTWTVLLAATFEGDTIANLEPQEQEDKVLNLIRNLETASGTTLGPKGYAIVLDRLLKRLNNPRAAQSVLNHMASCGAELTQYHYTILMTAYFQQQPPDFDSVEALWNQINTGKDGYGAVLGAEFYDRMIQGYATHHNVVGLAPMMSFLSRAESEGKLSSWSTLKCVVTAFAEQGEWSQLSRFVNKTRKSMRDRGVGGTDGAQHSFWTLVISTGVLDREGISTPSQITRENMGHREGSDRSDPRAESASRLSG